MVTMTMKHHPRPLLFSLSLLLLLSSHSTTTLAQSPASAPAASATASAVATPAPTPSSAPTDIIRILKKAGGFTTLIRLLQTTQVSNQINSQLLTSNGGLTLFAPNDNAFSSLKPGFLNSLNDQQKNELIQFHLLPQYVSTSNFDTLSNPVRTQAGENPDRLALNITSSGGNQVNMTTGIVNVTLGGTVYTDHQLAVYQVDKVLLPRDFFVAKPPAPAPAPEKSKGSKKKSADSTATEADDAESAAISVKQRHVMWVVVTVLVAAFSW
ncbi:fasciclin-like arabinogalactan protein 12 [Cajanus cajan]|uniref:fasciclin-like arabinogalactan protein 12 n=1 Tax=Cajanus cajan TaxID=3821 RepID=UPI00098D89E2|nr:fasciclin-like arabinogalactan protein 12 [Cajanus cajan]